MLLLKIHNFYPIITKLCKNAVQISVNGSKTFIFYLQVSWIRKQDLHILTMGSTIYSNDDRIEIVHPNRSDSTRNHNRDDWILRLHDTLPSDSGIYECQINTEPKKSKAYVLQVVGMSYFFVQTGA